MIILFNLFYFVQSNSNDNISELNQFDNRSIEIYPSDEGFILLENNRSYQTKSKRKIKIKKRERPIESESFFRMHDQLIKIDLTFDGSGESKTIVFFFVVDKYSIDFRLFG